MQIEEMRAAGGCALDQGRSSRSRSSRHPGAARRRRLDHPRADQCARGARPQAGRYRHPGKAARRGMVTTLGLSHPPKRIEVYDNSHIQGTNAVGAMIVAGPEGFMKNQYRKFNIKSEGPHPRRRLRHDAGSAGAALQAAVEARPKTAPPSPKITRTRTIRFPAMARPRHHRRRPRPAQRGARDL